jgi:hypothetical protein
MDSVQYYPGSPDQRGDGLNSPQSFRYDFKKKVIKNGRQVESELQETEWENVFYNAKGELVNTDGQLVNT